MKQCPQCRKTFEDEDSFCPDCGCRLEQAPKKGRAVSGYRLLGIIGVAAVFVFGFFSLGSFFSFRSDLEEGKNEKWLQQYYKELEEENSRPDVWDLSIVDSEKEYSSGSYGHITGIVRNKSRDKTVSSFTVTAKLKDRSGKVIGSDEDFFYGELGPGEETDFDIMYKKPSRTVYDYSLEIEEVR